MTKAEFVDKLAEKGKITKKLATESIETRFFNHWGNSGEW